MVEHPKYLSRRSLSQRRGPVVFGNVRYQPGGICGPRTQPNYQLVVLHKGALELQLDASVVRVAEGHGILLSPGHHEHFVFAADTETYHSWCAVEPHAVPARLQRQFETFHGPIPFVGKMATLLDMGQSVQWLSSGDDQGLEEGFYLGLALALLSEFAVNVRSGGGKADSSACIHSRMAHFISNHYAQQLKLADIARGIGVSRQQLLKVCRQSGLATPMRQLYRKRLEVAADLLAHTGGSVGEIADRCGFVNIFHFSRRFKEVYRCSPSVWRSKLWAKASP